MLATQLLSLSRADLARQDKARLRQVFLPVLIDDVIASFLDAALARQQDLGAETSPAEVRAAEWHVRELISNLIDNAIQYSPDGSRITVRCARLGEQALLEVEDDGPGIPITERERVFERFHRVPGTAGTGSGLGLAIVKDIADLYGGELRIEPGESGRGTRIRILFPPLDDARVNPSRSELA